MFAHIRLFACADRLDRVRRHERDDCITFFFFCDFKYLVCIQIENLEFYWRRRKKKELLKLIMELSKKKKTKRNEKEEAIAAATASADGRFFFLHTFMQIDDNILFGFV